MACQIELVRPSDYKTLKTAIVDGNYAECEDIVTKMNNQLSRKDVARWKVTVISPKSF